MQVVHTPPRARPGRKSRLLELLPRFHIIPPPPTTHLFLSIFTLNTSNPTITPKTYTTHLDTPTTLFRFPRCNTAALLLYCSGLVSLRGGLISAIPCFHRLLNLTPPENANAQQDGFCFSTILLTVRNWQYHRAIFRPLLSYTGYLLDCYKEHPGGNSRSASAQTPIIISKALGFTFYQTLFPSARTAV